MPQQRCEPLTAQTDSSVASTATLTDGRARCQRGPGGGRGGSRFGVLGVGFVNSVSEICREFLHDVGLKGVKIRIHSGCGSVVLVQETAEVVAALDGNAGR